VAPRRDWAGIWLQLVVQSVYLTYLNEAWMQACYALIERIEQLENEGREAVMCMGVLVARAGGHVKIEKSEVRAIENLWLRRRTSKAGKFVEFQLQPEEPED
jgi:hypothetical protein